ncbi:MAG: hypothetical protein ABEJ62_02935 [Candidatus Nanohaloarchaea archaeon]
MAEHDRGRNGSRYSLRLPDSYMEDVEDLAEQECFGSKTAVIYEAAREFRPYVGVVPLNIFEGETFENYLTIRYRNGDDFDRFLERSEGSDFAGKALALQNAVGVFTGEIEYDLDSMVEEIEQLEAPGRESSG